MAGGFLSRYPVHGTWLSLSFSGEGGVTVTCFSVAQVFSSGFFQDFFFTFDFPQFEENTPADMCMTSASAGRAVARSCEPHKRPLQGRASSWTGKPRLRVRSWTLPGGSGGDRASGLGPRCRAGSESPSTWGRGGKVSRGRRQPGVAGSLAGRGRGLLRHETVCGLLVTQTAGLRKEGAEETVSRTRRGD